MQSLAHSAKGEHLCTLLRAKMQLFCEIIAEFLQFFIIRLSL